MRKFIAGVAVAAALTTTLVMAASPASAHGAGCQVHTGSTYKAGSYVVGYGSIDNRCDSGSRATISIQRWTGLKWDSIYSQTINGPGYNHYISYSCAGTGTQTWRTLVSAKYADGHTSIKSTPSVRFSC